MNRKIALLASALVLSASLFAMGGNMKGGNEDSLTEKSTKSECQNKGEHFKHKFANLTDEQKKEVEKIIDKYSSDRNKIKIEIREKEIVVDKLMLEDKVDWTKVEKAVTDVSASHAKLRVLKLKERKEISQITGEKISFGFNKHGKRVNSDNCNR